MNIKLWCSYVGRGAPSNASGKRVGYGRTKEEASKAAGHWANQAAWERFRRVTVADHDRPSSFTTDDEVIAWEIVGTPGEYVPMSGVERYVVGMIQVGKYASAILSYLGEPYPVSSEQALSVEIMCATLAKIGGAQ